MGRDVIITCAVTGSADTVGKHPAIPITPKQIACAAVEAGRAGAAIAHIHVRDPSTGKRSMDVALYREVVERIRSSDSQIIINLTTGPGARFVPGDDVPMNGGPGSDLSSPAERVAHIQLLHPELCSLDVATMNFDEAAFVNIPNHIRSIAQAITQNGVRPELEVFEPGHIILAKQLISEGYLTTPALFQLCLGIPWGVPATPEALCFMRSLLPAESIWAAFGISRFQFPMVAQATLLGGHVRVGLEDNLYLKAGVLAPNNAALVEKAVDIVELLGESIATPKVARKLLGLAECA